MKGGLASQTLVVGWAMATCAVSVDDAGEKRRGVIVRAMPVPGYPAGGLWRFERRQALHGAPRSFEGGLTHGRLP